MSQLGRTIIKLPNYHVSVVTWQHILPYATSNIYVYRWYLKIYFHKGRMDKIHDCNSTRQQDRFGRYRYIHIKHWLFWSPGENVWEWCSGITDIRDIVFHQRVNNMIFCKKCMTADGYIFIGGFLYWSNAFVVCKHFQNFQTGQIFGFICSLSFNNSACLL